MRPSEKTNTLMSAAPLFHSAEKLVCSGHSTMAKTTDDLERMKEYDFLERLAAISVIGKNVKKELHDALALRNGCGHPTSLHIAEAKVAAHLEVLILNVFSKY